MRAAGTVLAALLLARAPAASGAPETLVKDIVRPEEAVTNALTGVGLVVGLAGTGDKSARTKKLALQLYKGMGNVYDMADLDSKNMAAVTVTASLPPFKASGDRIDVKVASSEGATSLRGGVLLTSNLTGPGLADVKPVVVFAQGEVIVVEARPGNAGHGTTGTVPNGGMVLDPNPAGAAIVRDGRIVLILQNPDFANAGRVAQAVNAEFAREAGEVARAESPSRIVLTPPAPYRDVPAEFLSRVMELPVSLLKERARVSVDRITGVVIATGDVELPPLKGSIASGKDFEIGSGGSLQELLKALHRVATPAEKVQVLTHLHEIGALRAELVIP